MSMIIGNSPVKQRKLKKRSGKKEKIIRGK